VKQAGLLMIFKKIDLTIDWSDTWRHSTFKEV